MEIATSVKQLLHTYGIHSTTVQPEFVAPRRVKHSHSRTDTPNSSGNDTSDTDNIEISTSSEDDTDGDEGDELTANECLLRCTEESCVEQACCPPVSTTPTLSAVTMHSTSNEALSEPSEFIVAGGEGSITANQTESGRISRFSMRKIIKGSHSSDL
jgi:zinc transporter 1